MSSGCVLVRWPGIPLSEGNVCTSFPVMGLVLTFKTRVSVDTVASAWGPICEGGPNAAPMPCFTLATGTHCGLAPRVHHNYRATSLLVGCAQRHPLCDRIKGRCSRIADDFSENLRPRQEVSHFLAYARPCGGSQPVS